MINQIILSFTTFIILFKKVYPKIINSCPTINLYSVNKNKVLAPPF